MTLVLGAICKNGVAVVGDRKITLLLGTVLKYDDKLFGVIQNVIFGYAGVETMFDIFSHYVVGDVIMKRDDTDNKYTPANLMEKLSSIMKLLKEARSNQSFDLRVIVARQFPNSNAKSDLAVVDSLGNVKNISARYVAIGRAEQIGKRIMDEEWKRGEEITMEGFAKLAYYTIKKIEKQKLDLTVGGEPMIRYLKNGGEIDKSPSEEEIKMFQSFLDSKIQST